MNLYISGQKAFGRAVFEMALEEGHKVVGVSAPLEDKLRDAAERAQVPVLPAGLLNADRLPERVDLIMAAHSHDFIGRRTRNKTTLGAIGYHPSLLPRHRGRDAIRWTIKMGDPITGGTVYWLSDHMDGGDIAAQEHIHVRPGDTASELWQRDLFPLGVHLFRQTLQDLSAGRIIAIPQDEKLATWEPSWERPPVNRPDLLMIGAAPAGYEVFKEPATVLQGQ